ncbi:MAG: peptidase S41 [Chloroflexi bacterium]|nr:peptidase S41 [Chloroflexota bacterium]
MTRRPLSIFAFAVTLALAACNTAAPTATPPPTQAPEPTATPAPAPDQPVQITGTVEVTSDLIIEVYFFEKYVLLEDLTGFVTRDYEYEQPLDGQIIGPVSVDDEGNYTFTLNLPAEPISPLNDVDNDGSSDPGVQVWQITMSANYIDDPFLGKEETAGWSSTYTSAKIDSENKNELSGGVLLIWSPDDAQQFPTGFGDDDLLFTADDPVGSAPAGYSLIDLDAEPFEIIRETHPAVTLYEGDVAVNDYSEMTWTEAFEALHSKASREYPFTEEKGIDWDALHDEFAPRIADAEKSNDTQAYYLALRDYSWSIPDGHVGLSGDDFGLFAEATAGGYGFAIIRLTDGRTIAHIVLDSGPAAEAGMLRGAEVIEWNGKPVGEAAADVIPWSSPFSNDEVKQLQQYRYLLRAPLDTEAEVTFKNPGEADSITATLTSVAENTSFRQTSFFFGFDSLGLPVQYDILPSGFGYIKITSLSEDINLIIRLWERAVKVMIENGAPGIIVDMRQNGGGSPLGSFFASYFVTERIDLSRSYYYSEATGQLETFGPPDYIEPDPDLYYDGKLAVLVGPACASACEDVSWVLGQLPQTTVVGFYSTHGIYGEVARGQYELPEGYSFQIPTGLTRDLQGNLIIEGPGVAPDLRVPLNESTVFSDGDVILRAAETSLLGIGPDDTQLDSGLVLGAAGPTKKALNAAEPLFLESLAEESYSANDLSQMDRAFPYTIALEGDERLIWGWGWCATSQSILNDNYKHIQLAFSVDGEAVDSSKFTEVSQSGGGLFCKSYYTLVFNWPGGDTALQTVVTFDAPINDGQSDYPAGAQTFDYTVTAP